MGVLGYSTGAIALGDFSRAVRLLAGYDFRAIELSALRVAEVAPLIEALPTLDLTCYSYVSFHAPSLFEADEEETLIRLLNSLPDKWPIVLHPDTIHNPALWAGLAPRLAIENMDRRKGTGRSAAELADFFRLLPTARMCLDLGHARQVDSSMVGAYQLLKAFGDRIVQLHISEVDTFNRHDLISAAAEIAFCQIRQFIPQDVAVILESRVQESEIRSEAEKVMKILYGHSDILRAETALMQA